jgi:hypothetical protein
MSTITGIGPALDIDGPLPVAPEHSLLETQLRTPDGGLRSVVVERDARRVLNGANVWGYPTGCSLLWEPCTEGTFRVKDDGSTGEEDPPAMPISHWDPFVVYKPVICSAITLRDRDEFNRRISAALRATMSAAVETALLAGVGDNPAIGDANVDDLTPTPGTAVSPAVGQAILENAIGGTCRAGMIGATPATLASLQTFPFGGFDGQRLVTVNGTAVYSSDGLIGLETDDLDAPDAGEDWMVAHGPVDVYLGPIDTFDVRSSLDRSDNTLVMRAEIAVVAVWDTALQAAVLVDWAS